MKAYMRVVVIHPEPKLGVEWETSLEELGVTVTVVDSPLAAIVAMRRTYFDALLCFSPRRELAKAAQYHEEGVLPLCVLLAPDDDEVGLRALGLITCHPSCSPKQVTRWLVSLAAVASPTSDRRPMPMRTPAAALGKWTVWMWPEPSGTGRARSVTAWPPA